MITLIHITEKQTGKILDYIPLGDFWDDNHHKSLKDTLEYFEFRTFGDKRYSQHLEKMNRIIIPDEDGTFIEFVIFHAIKYRLQNTIVIDVYAPASYLLLKKAKVIKPQRLEGYTAAQHADFALAGTEWKVGRVDYAGIRTITIENHTNPYAYLKRIASEFDLELHFRVEVDGNKVIGRYVDLLKRVGEWQGREVEFGRDLLGIERKVDDSNVVTALIGIGPERDDGTRLEVFVEDEEALQRWGIPNPQTGELMHLIETYEPESTDQDMTIERLTELTRNELEKRINSVVEYTADVADLEKVPGMENKKIRFGDTIKIKDVGFNPPLYLEARVHTQDRSLSQPEKKKVTLGDFIEYTEEEVHAIWKQLQAEIAKKVSMADVIEVVYTKPEVDERDDAVREHAENVAENAKREAIQEAAEDASRKAQQAEDNAKEYTDGRLENTVAKDIFESTVTDLLNKITQKVDSTRFEQVESELRGIAEGLQREIEEHADTLEEHGGKITKLETDVDEVEGKINATISELEALNDTVSRHETQIDANAREIALKADKQELDLLSGTVSDISSELSVMAGKIEAKAERSEVEKLESDVSKVSQDVSKLTIDVDGIKTNVSSISQTVSNHGTQISSINSTLTQHAGMIATKVEKSEFDSVTNSLGNRISTIEQTADSISLEVSDIKANVYTKSEVDSAINGIQIGGRNLIKNSGNFKELGNWRANGSGASITLTQKDGFSVLEGIKSIAGENVYGIKNNTEYVFSAEVMFDRDINVTANNPLHCQVAIEGNLHGGKESVTLISKDTVAKANTWTVIAVKIKTKSEVTIKYFRPFIYGLDDGTKFWVKWWKLEEGNKPTAWTPAPEDIDTQIADIQGTLTSHSTKIEQNAQQIQLRATKTEVNTLTGRVNTVESTIQQHADMIASKVEKSEFDSVTNNLGNRISTIEQTADGISLEVSNIKANVYTKSEVDSAIGNIQVGTRNLLMNGDFSKTYKGESFTVDGKTYDTYPSQWGGYNGGINNPKTSYHAHIDNDTFGFNVVEYNETNGQRNWKGINQSGLEKRLSPTQTGVFTFSVDVYATGTGTRLFGGFYYYRKSGGSNGFYSGQFNIVPTEINKWVRMSAQCRLNDDVDFSKNISFYIYGYNFSTNSILYIKNVKLEYGNKATDWTPAPEDVQGQIDNIQDTLASHSTRIEQNAQQIQLRATKTEVDELTGRISTVESTIRQHADLIESKIDDGQARSIFRQEASSFTFEASQINFKGHVFGEDATFTGRLEGATGSFSGTVSASTIIGSTLRAPIITGTDDSRARLNMTNGSFAIEIDSGSGNYMSHRVMFSPSGSGNYYDFDIFSAGARVANFGYGSSRIYGSLWVDDMIVLDFNTTLWSGAIYLLDTHVIRPSKTLSNCMTGWILQWQYYQPGVGKEDHNYQFTYIPKATLKNAGTGHRALLRVPDRYVTKYFFVRNETITGHASNGEGDNRYLVLTAIYEF